MKKLSIIILPIFLLFFYIFSAMYSFHQVHKSIYYNDKQLSKNYIEWEEVKKNFKDFLEYKKNLKIQISNAIKWCKENNMKINHKSIFFKKS